MTAEDAYDDCIKAAREGAKRQRASKYENEVEQELHKCAAITLDSFAEMLTKMKAIRCP